MPRLVLCAGLGARGAVNPCAIGSTIDTCIRYSANDRVSQAILCGRIKPVPWAPFELAERTDGGGKAGDDVVRNDRRVLRGDAAGRTV